MSWNTDWIEFDAMTEVLLTLLEVSKARILSGQMNAGSKVSLVVEKALLEMGN